MRNEPQFGFESTTVKTFDLPTDHVELLWRTLMYSVGSFAVLFFIKYAF